MEYINDTTVTEFVLTGLSQTREVQLVLFAIFLSFYLFILPVNILIICTIRLDHHLNSPMYFLLANLAFLDIWYSSITAPKMLVDFFVERKIISFGGCITQLFFLHFVGACEGLLLVVMAFDRYIAICRPLHYSTVMSPRACYAMLMALWFGGFVHSIVQVVLILRLPFCGPNHLDNFFCDVPQVIKLACTDTFAVELLMVFNISSSGVIALISFLLLLVSYIVVLVTIRDHSSIGSSKALSTCTSHFIVVLMFFIPCIFIYVWPFTNFLVDKILSVFYTIFTPFLNPLIYTLRNQEVRAAVKKKISNHYFPFGKTTPRYTVRGLQRS
ncbi:Olfactory receptor 734 [Lemmus lemmus]